jgi:leucyl-tRNA synthetase
MAEYNPKEIEPKWQKIWLDAGAFNATETSGKPKWYGLIEFPYPSGDGLHVGHVRSNTAMDIIARKRRAEGFEVLYPIGWDAFGLPTENYAIKTGTKPAVVTKKNTDTFRRQLQSLGFSFDWSREIDTTDPKYYKWTQWIFLQFLKAGLAYKKKMEINWCPKDKIGLANEEVVNGCCERCGTAVEKREKEQWMLAITKYADRLDKDLDTVNYLEKIKIQQRNWIGKSEGAEIIFPVAGTNEKVTVFTTRADTIFGATYVVLAPEHELISKLGKKIGNFEEVAAYVAAARAKEDLERTAEGKEKTGVELKGIKAINPATGGEIPVFVADYVLAHYGTGAVMAVPAHDERDWKFATEFLPLEYAYPSDGFVRHVIEPKDSQYKEDKDSFSPRFFLEESPGKTWEQLEQNEWFDNVNKLKNDRICFSGKGILVNSAEFSGLDSEAAKKKIVEKVGGKIVTKFKLRDWVFSRQRYWGEPIPVIHCEKCGIVPVPEKDLPVLLPDVEKYEPTETGESPLANISEWVNVTCPTCSGNAKRETDTMPQWAGSSWYFLRYADPLNESAFASKDALKYWTPVDWYNGGMEHTTLHLLYSRFWHKFLFDQGLVPTAEPYTKRTSHGLILALGGEKMSKSKGNVVNPDSIVERFGADALRLYEMFMGPFDQAIAWNEDGLVGTRRFLERVWRLGDIVKKDAQITPAQETAMHQTIDKVSRDIEELKMNTAVSALMIFTNELEKATEISPELFASLLRLLNPFAPHMTEELWEVIDKKMQLWQLDWPKADPAKLAASELTIAIQINGKLRDTMTVSQGISEDEAKEAALARPAVQKWLAGGTPKMVKYVPGRLVTIVVSEGLDVKAK